MREEKTKHHTCSLSSYRSLSASLLFSSSYQSPNNTSPSLVAKRLAFGKVKSSLEPNAAHSRKSWSQNQQSPYCNRAGQKYVTTRMMKGSSSLDLQEPGLGTILGLQFCDFFHHFPGKIWQAHMFLKLLQRPLKTTYSASYKTAVHIECTRIYQYIFLP